jgi:hypothetical protein
MEVRRMYLHQQGCHAPCLHCVSDQAPGLLCHCGWRYSGRNGKDNKSGLLQAGARCYIGNSCACRHRGGSYFRQWGRCQGGAYCRQWTTCCGRECGHAPCTGSPIGVRLCEHCHSLGQYDGQLCRNLCQG